MKTKILGLLAVAMLAGPMAANAVSLMRLDGTSANPEVGDFFVLFADTGDGILQIEEVTFFSGVTVSNVFGIFNNPILYVVGDVTGFTTASPLVLNCNTSSGPLPWCVGDSQPRFLLPAQLFSYRISNQVPEPGTLALLGLGLAGLGLSRRRKA